jgi:hypothetical protein
MIIALSLMCVALLALLLYREEKDSALVCKLLVRMDSLQQDNKALMEALVCSEGKPLVFRKSPMVDGVGWFDRVKVSDNVPTE